MDNTKCVKKIVLNGLVGDVNTYDENDSTIGVLYMKEQKTLSGEVIVDEESGFPLSKSMEDEIGWRRKMANVQMVFSDSRIDPQLIEQRLIETYYGIVETGYSHYRTELSGYLWTSEDFEVGGHDIMAILNANRGKWIHMEIDLYEETK